VIGSTRNNLGTILIWSVITAAVTATSPVQVSRDTEAELQLDGAWRTRMIHATADLVERHYFDPGKATELADELRSSHRNGAYDDLLAPADLAAALTRQLEVHDRHFWVSWSPPGNVEPVNADPHSEESGACWREWSRLQNFGFRSVQVLPGNVGYLDLRYFDDTLSAGDTATAAMGLLANAGAVIVDVRNNGGGEPAMVQLLISHFMGPDPVQYNAFVERGKKASRQLWTLAYLPGKRLPDVPLFVLTSARTGSAAEAFAYSLQALGRARIVGQTTAGAANPGESFDIGEGFSIFISTGAPVNPITGTNWEGIGVRPDLEVDSLEALQVAHHEALKILIEDARSEIERREIAWALDALGARRNPVVLPASVLEDYSGDYGTRKIRITDGRLTYQRSRRATRTMLPLEGQDLFVLEGVDGFRIRFDRDDAGRVIRMVDQWSDGHREANPRAH
jgi:hypothetical protein